MNEEMSASDWADYRAEQEQHARMEALYAKYGYSPEMYRQNAATTQAREINGQLYVPLSASGVDDYYGSANFYGDPTADIKAMREAAAGRVITQDGQQWSPVEDYVGTQEALKPYQRPDQNDFITKALEGFVIPALQFSGLAPIGGAFGTTSLFESLGMSNPFAGFTGGSGFGGGGGGGGAGVDLMGGLDGALGDSVANYTAGMGAMNPLTTAGGTIGGMFSGGGMDGTNPGGLDGALGDAANAYNSGMGVNNALTTGGGGGGGGALDSLMKAFGLTGSPSSYMPIASLLSGLVGAGAANSAANTQAGAADRATQAQMQMFNTINQQQAPWRQAGQNALSQIGGMSDYFNHQFNNEDLKTQLAPNYQFQLNEGLRGVTNAMNLQSGWSGNTLRGINDYAQNFAGGAYQNAFNNYQAQQNNIFNRLANIAGLGQTATANTGNAGTTLAGNAGNSTMAGGAAQAAGTVGAANAISGGANNALGWYSLPQIMQGAY